MSSELVGWVSLAYNTNLNLSLDFKVIDKYMMNNNGPRFEP